MAVESYTSWPPQTTMAEASVSGHVGHMLTGAAAHTATYLTRGLELTSKIARERQNCTFGGMSSIAAACVCGGGGMRRAIISHQ